MLVHQLGGADPAVDEAHIGPELQPQDLDELVQGLQRVGAVQGEVEGEIALHVGGDVARLQGGVDGAVDLPEPAQPRRGDVGQGEYGRLRLQQQPAAQKVVEPVRGHGRDAHLALGADLDRALRRQPAQSLAHGGLADPELLGQAAGREAAPREDLAGDETPPELAVDAGVQQRVRLSCAGGLELVRFQRKRDDLCKGLHGLETVMRPSWCQLGSRWPGVITVQGPAGAQAQGTQRIGEDPSAIAALPRAAAAAPCPDVTS